MIFGDLSYIAVLTAICSRNLLMGAQMNAPTLNNSQTPWLTLRQGAVRANTSEATLRREIHRGALRHARVGGRKDIRLRPEWVDSWLETGSSNATATDVAEGNEQGARALVGA